jgi:hypothetical protein
MTSRPFSFAPELLDSNILSEKGLNQKENKKNFP